MISRLVIEINHSHDSRSDWDGSKWSEVHLREYIEHEGVGGITIIGHETSETGAEWE